MDRPIDNQIPFDVQDAGRDPYALFDRWFTAAMQFDPHNAAVAALATVSSENRPSLRYILLKKQGVEGFVFYTNYESRKGVELAGNPAAALTFWWPAFERQVRVEGDVHPVSEAESDAYFASRPRESQISAWASPQSRSIVEPVTLDVYQEQFAGQQIVRPAYWGGLVLVPSRFEFWQGRASRLHDRVQFSCSESGWQIDRLAP